MSGALPSLRARLARHVLVPLALVWLAGTMASVGVAACGRVDAAGGAGEGASASRSSPAAPASLPEAGARCARSSASAPAAGESSRGAVLPG